MTKLTDAIEHLDRLIAEGREPTHEDDVVVAGALGWEKTTENFQTYYWHPELEGGCGLKYATGNFDLTAIMRHVPTEDDALSSIEFDYGMVNWTATLTFDPQCDDGISMFSIIDAIAPTPCLAITLAYLKWRQENE